MLPNCTGFHCPCHILVDAISHVLTWKKHTKHLQDKWGKKCNPWVEWRMLWNEWGIILFVVGYKCTLFLHYLRESTCCVFRCRLCCGDFFSMCLNSDDSVTALWTPWGLMHQEDSFTDFFFLKTNAEVIDTANRGKDCHGREVLCFFPRDWSWERTERGARREVSRDGML